MSIVLLDLTKYSGVFILHQPLCLIQAAWTPQQDLEETSSDGGLESAPLSPESLPLAKFTPRFSLSLPREDRLAVYTQSDDKVVILLYYISNLLEIIYMKSQLKRNFL